MEQIAKENQKKNKSTQQLQTSGNTKVKPISWIEYWQRSEKIIAHEHIPLLHQLMIVHKMMMIVMKAQIVIWNVLLKYKWQPGILNRGK